MTPRPGDPTDADTLARDWLRATADRWDRGLDLVTTRQGPGVDLCDFPRLPGDVTRAAFVAAVRGLASLPTDGADDDR